MKVLAKLIGYILAFFSVIFTFMEWPYTILQGIVGLVTSFLLIYPHLVKKWLKIEKLNKAAYAILIGVLIFIVWPFSVSIIPEVPSVSVQPSETYDIETDDKIVVTESPVKLQLKTSNVVSGKVNQQSLSIDSEKSTATISIPVVEDVQELEFALSGLNGRETTQTITVEYITPEMKAQRDEEKAKALALVEQEKERRQQDFQFRLLSLSPSRNEKGRNNLQAKYQLTDEQITELYMEAEDKGWKTEAKDFVEKERIKLVSSPNKHIEIVKNDWHKTGFGSIPVHDITLKNLTDYNLKDFTIRAEYYSESGTLLDVKTETIYQTLNAGETKTFSEINFGFVHDQVAQSKISVEKVALY